MALVDLVMPKLGESIMEATVLRWTKKVGEQVKLDETLLEIATDKVDSEVPSTTEGILAEILFHENDVVPVGTIIARIENDKETVISEPAEIDIEVIAEKNEPLEPYVHEEEEMLAEQLPYVPRMTNVPAPASGSMAKFYSPLVLNIAGNEGVSMSELEHIPGTGNEGRVTKKDILQYVENRKSGGGNGVKPTRGTMPTAAEEAPKAPGKTAGTNRCFYPADNTC